MPYSLYFNNDILNEDLLIPDVVHERSENMSPAKQVVDSNNISVNSVQANVQQPACETSPAFKVVSNSLLGNYNYFQKHLKGRVKETR